MTKGKHLYRDPQRGKIAGVCVGIADYFGLELWLVRIAMLTGLILSGSLFFVGYIAAWFILDKKHVVKPHCRQTSFKGWSGQEGKGATYSKGWQCRSDDDDEQEIEIKARVWQAGEPPREAFQEIKQRFNELEQRLQGMETYVTSNAYQLKREISRL